MGNIINYLNEYGDKRSRKSLSERWHALFAGGATHLKFDGIVPAIAQRERGNVSRD